ncbi:MAG: NADP transhydrogenase subunit alpha [Spirochaetales bacterium]|nr:NADP transhydrogenase subunit alpha [Spirochaetales bacterium]
MSTSNESVRAQTFCVLGAGNGGLAMAGHLAWMGFSVHLYNRSPLRLQGVAWHGGVELSGAIEGFAPVETFTNLEKAVHGCDVLMVVTPANAHRELAQQLAPLVEDNQIIVLNPGRTGGALEFRSIWDKAEVTTHPILAETQTLLYAARGAGYRATIFRIKDTVPLATLPSYHIPRVLDILRPAFPQFTAGTNVLSTSLDNIGAVFHPALTVLNAAWIEATGGDFEYYLEGITPTLANFLEALDAERVAVATALGMRSPTVREWLFSSYGSTGKSLYEAIQNTPAYKGIPAPATIDHRYVSEDVPMSLVPIASLGLSLNVATPNIDLVIDLASTFHNVDYRAVGRSVDSLGLAGRSVKDISQFLAGGTR